MDGLRWGKDGDHPMWVVGASVSGAKGDRFGDRKPFVQIRRSPRCRPDKCGGFVETEATMPSSASSINPAPPLVRIERINGVVFAIFTDPARPGYEYDPSIRSARQALEIARHVADKTWITDEHLEQFKALMLAEFGEASAHG